MINIWEAIRYLFGFSPFPCPWGHRELPSMKLGGEREQRSMASSRGFVLFRKVVVTKESLQIEETKAGWAGSRSEKLGAEYFPRI